MPLESEDGKVGIGCGIDSGRVWDLEERVKFNEKREGATVRATGLRNSCPQIGSLEAGEEMVLVSE